MGPKPPALIITHIKRKMAIIKTSGAAQFSKTLTALIPLWIIRIFKNQNAKKVIIEGIGSPRT
jgi:hypothetical protein